MKRILSIALALLVLLCGTMVGSVSAEETPTPTLSLTNADVGLGDTFTVDLCIDGNPGIKALKAYVSYDATLVELVEHGYMDFASSLVSAKPYYNDPYYVTFTASAGVNNYENGALLRLTFKVKAETPCVTTLRVDYVASETKSSRGPVSFDTQYGIVRIAQPPAGDLNEDGVVSNQDIALLQQHLVGWEVTPNLAVADVMSDGSVNNLDLAVLQRYLSGWGVVLDPPVVVPDEGWAILPAIGTDIDVTNKKGRFKITNTYQIGCTAFIEVTNKTTNWICEETDYIKYTCYDANGKVVQAATEVYLGTIDTKKNKIVVYNMEIPANTAEVRITGSKIVYWTEWS